MPRLFVKSIRKRVEAVLFSSSWSEGPGVFNDKLDFALEEGSSQCLVEHSFVGEGSPFCLYVRYCSEALDLLPAIMAMAHPNRIRRVM